MTSALPTDNALDKAVKDFGIGTYDSQSDASGSHGEDSESREPLGKNLPDGGPPDVFSPDRLLSYPDDPDVRTSSWWTGVFAAANVPGEIDRDVTHAHPNMSVIDSRVMSVSKGHPDRSSTSELPSDSDNPPARSDYYDDTVTGGVSNIWPKEDSGAYVSQNITSESELPGVMKNEEIINNNLQSLGNWQSGYGIEDVSGRQGFPSTDFSENTDFDRSDLQDGGRIVATRGYDMERTATNIQLVNGLTTEFLKEFGKKNLTKRHVLSFLQKNGEPQFLSSDIIRCLKLSHEIYVKDVLDEFPVAKKASGNRRIGSSTKEIMQALFDTPNEWAWDIAREIESSNMSPEEAIQFLYDDHHEKAWEIAHSFLSRISTDKTNKNMISGSSKIASTIEQIFETLYDTPHEWAWDIAREIESLGLDPEDAIQYIYDSPYEKAWELAHSLTNVAKKASGNRRASGGYLEITMRDLKRSHPDAYEKLPYELIGYPNSEWEIDKILEDSQTREVLIQTNQNELSWDGEVWGSSTGPGNLHAYDPAGYRDRDLSSFEPSSQQLDYEPRNSSSKTTIASIRDKLIQLEIDNITSPEVSSVYRRCAANFAKILADLERIEYRSPSKL